MIIAPRHLYLVYYRTASSYYGPWDDDWKLETHYGYPSVSLVDISHDAQMDPRYETWTQRKCPFYRAV